MKTQRCRRPKLASLLKQDGAVSYGLELISPISSIKYIPFFRRELQQFCRRLTFTDGNGFVISMVLGRHRRINRRSNEFSSSIRVTLRVVVRVDLFGLSPNVRRCPAFPGTWKLRGGKYSNRVGTVSSASSSSL